jgi:hypothetical protein
MGPQQMANPSTIKSLKRACRPGTNSCAASTAPAKIRSSAGRSAFRYVYPSAKAMPAVQKIPKCSRSCGKGVSGRNLGGTTERMTMALARVQARRRAGYTIWVLRLEYGKGRLRDAGRMRSFMDVIRVFRPPNPGFIHGKSSFSLAMFRRSRPKREQRDGERSKWRQSRRS